MSNISSLSTALWACLIVIMGAMLITTSNTTANSYADQIAEQQAATGKSGASLAVVENPELVVRVLDSLIRSVMYSMEVQSNQVAQKRGLDLGMTRGFSGSQAGKHLMGLSAASFANGPGR